MLGEERRRGGTPGRGVMQVVLDASALLAYLRAEPGSEAVDGVLGTALITSLNWAEVLQALGLALRLNLPVLTCDRLWAELTLPLRIQLLR